MFEFIEREKAAFEVQAICRTLGVSASGYYAWKLRLPCRRRREDERLKTLIAEIHRFSRGTYGAPRVRAELRFAHGLRCSEKRVARLMRLLGVHGVHCRRGRRPQCARRRQRRRLTWSSATSSPLGRASC